MSALLAGFKQAVMQTPKNLHSFKGAFFSHTQRKAYIFMSKTKVCYPGISPLTRAGSPFNEGSTV